MYISCYEKWPTLFEPGFRSLFWFALTGFSNFLLEPHLVLNLVSDITLNCHKSCISIWLIFLLFRAWFYGWRIYGRGPNLVIHLGPSSWRGFPRKTGIIYLLYRETFMLNWLVPAWVGSRNKKQQLSTMLFGGSSLTRSVTNGCSAVFLVINLAFWSVYLNCRLITYVYVLF